MTGEDGPQRHLGVNSRMEVRTYRGTRAANRHGFSLFNIQNCLSCASNLIFGTDRTRSWFVDVNGTVSPLGERLVSVRYIVQRSIMVVHIISQNAMLFSQNYGNCLPWTCWTCRKTLPKTNGCFLYLIYYRWNFRERTSTSYWIWMELMSSVPESLKPSLPCQNYLEHYRLTQPDLKHFLTRRFASCKTWAVFKHQKGTTLITQDSLIHSLLLKESPIIV